MRIPFMIIIFRDSFYLISNIMSVSFLCKKFDAHPKHENKILTRSDSKMTMSRGRGSASISHLAVVT